MALAKTLRRVGWVCFYLVWLPFGAGMLAMFGLPEGSYAFSELPLVTRVSIVAGGVLLVGAVTLLVGATIAGGVANRVVLAKGQLASARVLGLQETGTTINNRPLVVVRLNVQTSSGLSFEAETERLMSLVEIPQFQPGALVHVKYDPETQAVAILSAEDYEKSVR